MAKANKETAELVTTETETGENVVFATTITLPERVEVDTNIVLFKMIELLGTIDSFDGKLRVMKATLAYYNLLEEFMN